METIQGPDGKPIEVSDTTLLLVDDEENILSSLRRLLRKDGYRILSAGSGQEGLDILRTETVDIIISDQRMPQMVGTVFLRKARELSPYSVRMILSGYTDLESVTAAINEGAVYKFLTKPWDDEILRLSIHEAIRYKWTQDENRMLHGMLVEVNNELANANQQLAERAEFAQEALRNMQEIMHDLPIALIGMDDDGSLMFANKATLGIIDNNLPLGLVPEKGMPDTLLALMRDPLLCCADFELDHKKFRAQKQALSHKGQGYIIVIVPAEQSCQNPIAS